MYIPFGVFSAAAGNGGGGGAGAYELISSTMLSSDTASVSFSSIVGTYKHLQIRYTARSSTTSGGFFTTTAKLITNADTGGNYAWHYLSGSGTSVQSGGSSSTNSLLYVGSMPTSEVTSGIFGTAIIDILDYASTSKNKTFKTLSGHHSASGRAVWLASGLWASTSAITSLTLSSNLGNFTAGSRFSLYGIKG